MSSLLFHSATHLFPTKKRRLKSVAIRNSRGFTLIEILLAFFIFGIIAVTIFGSYRLVLSSANDILSVVSDDEIGFACFQRMRLDLHSVVVSLPPFYRMDSIRTVPDPYRFVGKVETIGNRDFATLRFTSLSHIPAETLPLESVAEIRYYVETLGPDQYVLKRSDRPYPLFDDSPTNNGYLICERVRSFSVTYFNGADEEMDNWDSDSPDFYNSTPKIVRIRFEIGDANHSKLFETGIVLPLSREGIRG